MKKIVLFSLLIAIFTVNINAQEVSFGIKAGLNFSKFYSDDAAINDMSNNRTAFHFGGLVLFSLSDKFAIQPELYYSSEGTSFKDSFTMDESVIDIKTNVNVNYISLPVMFKYSVNKNIYFEAGPQMDFLVSADSKTQTSDSINTEVGDLEDIKNDLDSNNYGFGMGIGYRADNGIFINTRYVLGLSDITKNEFTTIKNNGFHFSIGLIL